MWIAVAGTAVRRPCCQPSVSVVTTPTNSSPSKRAAPDIPAHGEPPSCRGAGGVWTRSTTYLPRTMLDPGLSVPTSCSLSSCPVPPRCTAGKPIAWQSGRGSRSLVCPQRTGPQPAAVSGATRSSAASSSATSQFSWVPSQTSRQGIRPRPWGTTACTLSPPTTTWAAVRTSRGPRRYPLPWREAPRTAAMRSLRGPDTAPHPPSRCGRRPRCPRGRRCRPPSHHPYARSWAGA
jgi:hypothetical protein